MVKTVGHGNVTHVLNTTHEEHIAVASLDRLGGGVDRAHGRTTQTVHGLRSRLMRDAGQQ